MRCALSRSSVVMVGAAAALAFGAGAMVGASERQP
jgi:hypothetical protein